MREGSSDQVRSVAKRLYLGSAGPSGNIRIALGDIQKVLLKEGFPSNHIRQIRTSLESSLFWEPLGLTLLSPRGQPDRVGTVLEFASPGAGTSRTTEQDPLLELRGILRGAIREGAAAFVRELRRDKDARKEPGNRPRRKSGDEENAA